jgi:peptide/nickel transport system substrate-binding protein
MNDGMTIGRRDFAFGVAAAGISAAGLSAADVRMAHAEDAPARGGTLTMIVTPEPTMLTAAFNTAGPMQSITPKIFDGLVEYDFDFNPRPQLATSWETAPDGLSITFHLRDGVRWHDGKPFTSADVAWSLLNVWKTLHGRGRGTYLNATGVDTPDPLTAVIRLSRPSPSIMNAIASSESQILPRHLYEGTDVLTNPANNAPVGTGPFRFKEWQRGSAIIVERNPDYWDATRPLLDRIAFRFIPDGAGRAAALESGEAQLAGDNPVPLNDVARLSRNPRLITDKRGYNSVNNIHFMEFNLRHPQLKDVRVRRAIAHTVNRDLITRSVWFGLGKASTSPVPATAARFHTDAVPAYKLDIAAANALLDEAGFARGSDGMRFKLFIDWAPYGDAMQRTAEVVKQALKGIGIDVEIRSSDLPGWLRRVYTDNDFDMTTFFLSAMPDPTIGLQRFFWSKSIQKGVAFSNASGYANPEMDAILEAAGSEIDLAKRQALFAKFQVLAMTDLPILPLVDLDQVTFADQRVHDYTTGAGGIRTNMAGTWIAAA